MRDWKVGWRQCTSGNAENDGGRRQLPDERHPTWGNSTGTARNAEGRRRRPRRAVPRRQARGAIALGVGLMVGALLGPASAGAQRRGGSRTPSVPTNPGTASDATVASDDAAARDAEARRLFDIGAQAFAGGRYAEALDHFEASYRLSGRAALLYNIGITQDRLRRDREAIESFERFLREVPDTNKREEVEGRLEALRAAVRRAEEAEARAEQERERLAREAREAEERAARAAAGNVARDASPSVFERWWFWTIVGVVVVGGVTAALVATHDPGTEPPIPGTGGVVVMALGGP
jgi:tetratricopeptide (TPR) repeat protein